MEIRRVQVTGGASFVVTLPKAWADEQKIKKNDPVGLEVQPDGALLVTKKITDEPVQRVKVIDSKSFSDPAFLFRMLIGAYITGFTTIRLTTKDRFPPFVRTVVRDFTQMTIGQEVVEETATSIAIKDLLNPAEMPFENTIRRMYVVARAMHEDAITALETQNKTLAHDVINRDTDADRLNWLVARQTNMIMQNALLSRKMAISPSMVMHYYMLSRIIERVGDHAVRIAEHALPIIDADVDKKVLAAIRKASAMSLETFDRSIVSFFEADMKEAHRNIESISALEKICGDINNMVLKLDTPVAINLGYIAESIRRSGEYAGDISETVINLLVEHEHGPHKSRAGK
ncbi:phosphate uptake regulator PhoU [Methanoregula formicica]|uniref:Phosphate uptake regulator n=1 Tax=Methanoregula formicica (strain DSM 22288 / NBRC 105244 / SMSP) TaxID=593750 RepID=L0HH36_METFS|nr:phosphate uptake regulator PhoU [Methanoregula formicica]AGB03091.1 phosphate uptake regulator [Methanoregula formicica SMSP]